MVYYVDMKKIITLILVIIIAGAVIWKFNASSTNTSDNGKDEASVPTSQTVTVSTKISEYKNDELGFSVKYPTAWEKLEASNNVSFLIPVDSKEKNTIGKLEAKVDIFSGKCAFPPVTSVKERSTLAVGDMNLNMISIANTVQGKNYFNRMYSLQKDTVCYFFTFASITSSPSSKGFTGADLQTVAAKNTVLVDAADTQFKDMVKSFKFVVGAAGQDEAKVAPKK